MNLNETLEMLKTLHSVGASHFKSQDFEVTLNGNSKTEATISLPSTSIPHSVAPALTPEQVQANEEAAEKIKGLVETLKMDDMSILNKVFPAGAEL